MEFSMLRDIEDINFFSKLIHETVHVPVFYINKELETITGFPETFKTNPIYSPNNNFFEQLDIFNDPLQVPVFRTTKFQENFISINLGSKDACQGALILGPSISSVPSNEIINGLLNDYQIRVQGESLKEYYRSIPVISRLTLMHAGLLTTYLLYSKRLSVSDVIYRDNDRTNNYFIEINPDLQMAQNRQEISFHSSYQLEQELFQCVKEGRKEDIKSKLSVTPDGRLGVLSKKSYLRSQKNLVIAAIALTSRHAIDGGLHPEMAYTMADLYIQELEELKDVSKVQTFMEKSFYDFADRVNKDKQHKYKTPIIECQSYIFKHLYEDITLEQLANVVNVHPNYLSTLFKKEVGLTVKEYILKQKVDEAKKLLTHSDYSLSEIYTWLNFHDQSHFTKVFKKYAGTTPKKYKSQLM
jgi:AraC-like DNA-binding protein